MDIIRADKSMPTLYARIVLDCTFYTAKDFVDVIINDKTAEHNKRFTFTFRV